MPVRNTQPPGAHHAILRALRSADAQHAASTEDIALVVFDALVDAQILTAPERRDRSLLETSPGHLAECVLPRGHSTRHTGAGPNPVTWTDDQSAGVLRERTT